MLGLVAGLPLLTLIGFYSWAMVSVHGLIYGLHLAALAVSFFVIFTPLPSYLFIFGLFPGHFSRVGRNIGVFMFWFACLGLNALTFIYFPKFYYKSPITKVSFEALHQPFVRNFGIGLSGLSLVYHWLVSRIESRFLRFWFNIIGIVISAFLFYTIIPAIREVLIVVFNAGNENY